MKLGSVDTYNSQVTSSSLKWNQSYRAGKWSKPFWNALYIMNTRNQSEQYKSQRCHMAMRLPAAMKRGTSTLVWVLRSDISQVIVNKGGVV